jgi:aspartate racemase
VSDLTAEGVRAHADAELIAAWNQTQTPYSSVCLHELFEDAARKSPNATAVVHGQHALTYAELNARANTLARHLRSLGAARNVPVAIGLPSSLEFAVSLLGVLKAGGACVPLDPAYPQERLRLMLEDVQTPVLITRRGLFPQVASSATIVVDFDSLSFLNEAGTQSENIPGVATPRSVAYIIYTSGSTGTPKGVLLGHRGLVNHSIASLGLYGLRGNDRMLQFSSISFDIAIEEIFPTWATGATVVLKPEEFSLGFSEFMTFLQDQKISVLDLPTAYWHEWTNYLHENPRLALPETLRLVIVGGEKVSAAVLARWQQRVAGRIRWVNTYGPSEASVIATAFEPASSREAFSSVPIGRPIANTQIHLLDADRQPVGIGAPGEIYIGGDGVALGYLNRPNLTAEKFVRDLFSSHSDARMYRTGDMARYREDGEIEFLGRQDNQIKIRGFRVEPGEIEEVLARHDNVREAAVISQESSTGEKRLLAYVVMSQMLLSDSDDRLRTYLKERLPEYMVPAAIVLLDAMPLTPNGKIDRRALTQMNPAMPAQNVETPKDGSVSGRIAAIWGELLGRPVSLSDNFFEIGGHSLLAARMMHQVGQLIGRALPLAMLLQAPTIEELCAALQGDGMSRYWSSIVAIQPKGGKAPFFCIHGVGGNVVGFRDLGRYMGPTHPFYGLQARGLDGTHPCLTSVEDMAVQYLQDIRSVQPEGPYFLGGYSFGGLVAYEMARQLTQRGEKVAFLALFDTSPGHVKPQTASLLKSLSRPTPKFLFSDLPRGVYKGIRRRWRGLRVPRSLKNVFFANTQAAEKYALQPYEGKITLFRATEKSLRAASNPYAAWREMALGGLEFQDIPGDHYGVLVEPQVAVFAERLKACVDQASASAEASSILKRAVS